MITPVINEITDGYMLTTVSEEVLKEYFTQESFKHIAAGTQQHNSDYISYSEGIFDLTTIHVLTKDNRIAAFCIVPKYNKDVTMRIYVGQEHRRKGLASFLLDSLKITELSCLKDNEAGLALYKKLGFRTKAEYSWLINLIRD